MHSYFSFSQVSKYLLKKNYWFEFLKHVCPPDVELEYSHFSTGWGQTEYTGPKSDVLLKVSLTVTTNNYCSQMHPSMIITSNQMCTYTPGKDTCQSDSGGKGFLKIDSGVSNYELKFCYLTHFDLTPYSW